MMRDRLHCERNDLDQGLQEGQDPLTKQITTIVVMTQEDTMTDLIEVKTRAQHQVRAAVNTRREITIEGRMKLSHEVHLHLRGLIARVEDLMRRYTLQDQTQEVLTRRSTTRGGMDHDLLKEDRKGKTGTENIVIDNPIVMMKLSKKLIDHLQFIVE